MSKRNFFSFIGCFAAVISALCCAAAFAEGASSAKTTSFGTLVLICAGIALTIYEMGLFIVGIGLGLTRWDRVFSFLFTAAYSFGVMILLYPLINKIGLIGGTTWKE